MATYSERARTLTEELEFLCNNLGSNVNVGYMPSVEKIQAALDEVNKRVLNAKMKLHDLRELRHQTPEHVDAVERAKSHAARRTHN